VNVVRILTNPGSNLRAEVIRAYEIGLSQQSIVVDGVAHDTRERIPLDTVDRWVQSAAAHPHVVGTTAAETIEICRELSKVDKEILIVTTSRKIIQTHAAAVTAARVLADAPLTRDTRVSIVDTGVTDVATALTVILAGECRRAGFDLARTTTILEAFVKQVHLAIVPRTLDWLVAGGRAGVVRAKLAEWLGRTPVLGMVDGEIQSLGLVSSRRSPDPDIVERLVGKLGKGRRVWVGVAHGAAPEIVAPLVEELRSAFDVAFAYTAPLSSSIYLHGGRGARLVAAAAIDELPFGFAPKPPSFDAF
jgi:DegV family protein with EDD domain